MYSTPNANNPVVVQNLSFFLRGAKVVNKTYELCKKPLELSLERGSKSF